MSVINNYKEVLDNISNICADVDRKKDDVNLIAVTKTHGIEKIEPIIKAGHKAFGENKVQEAYSKWVELKNKYKDLELHLIGPLQSNKTKEAVELFDVIESVDRVKLADKIAKEVKETGKNIECFIQINTGEEPQKAGVLPLDADDFIKYCKEDLKLNVTGLMCIPPFDEEPSPHFAFLKKIAKKHDLKKLSMGMSDDYEIAISLGATHVRVGSAIFGSRY